VLSDQRLGKRGLRLMFTERFGADSHIGDFLFFNDPPEQQGLRRIVRQAWTQRLMDALAETSRSVCSARLAGFKTAGGGDLAAEFAWRIPIPVIGSLFGLPAEHSGMIEAWGRDLFLATDMTRPDRLPAGRQALRDMYAYFADHLAAARARQPDVFLASLAAASREGSTLSPHELVIMALQLVIGGYDTTVNQIANGAYLLLSNLAQLRALQADWSLLGRAVEEILRYEPSTPFIGREALTDISVGTTAIAAGDFVGLVAGSR
jgi:cytochrome P450